MNSTEALTLLEIAERQYERYPFSIPAEHKLKQARTAYSIVLSGDIRPSESNNERATTTTITDSKSKHISLREDRRRGGFRKRY